MNHVLLRSLEGFHLYAARRITGKLPKLEADGTWSYPPSEKVLRAAGLYSIEHYIGVRRRTIMKHIVDRPIFGFCEGGVRKRGSSVRQFWWTQTFNLDAASGLTEPDVTADDEEDEVES